MKPNTFVLDRSKFKTKEEFNTAIGNAIRMFTDADYQVKAYWDDIGVGIFVIEYDHAKPEFGITLEWHDEVEDMVMNDRDEDCD